MVLSAYLASVFTPSVSGSSDNVAQLTSSQQVRPLTDIHRSLYASAFTDANRRVHSLSARSFKVLHVRCAESKGDTVVDDKWSSQWEEEATCLTIVTG